jgi:hypothetical protein
MSHDLPPGSAKPEAQPLPQPSVQVSINTIETISPAYSKNDISSPERLFQFLWKALRRDLQSSQDELPKMFENKFAVENPLEQMLRMKGFSSHSLGS